MVYKTLVLEVYMVAGPSLNYDTSSGGMYSVSSSPPIGGSVAHSMRGVPSRFSKL